VGPPKGLGGSFLVCLKGGAMIEDDAAGIATAYFDAWKSNDFETMRSLVADDVTFSGRLSQTGDADDYMRGIE
jgi:ketosteroid isomerase-like protein